jgi:hypothetical protein
VEPSGNPNYPNAIAVATVIQRTSEMTRGELRILGKAVSKSRGYMGLKDPGHALQASQEVIRRAGLDDVVRRISDDAVTAAIEAAMRAATGESPDTTTQEAVEAYRLAPSSLRKGPSRHLRRLVQKRVGLRLTSDLGSASLGAEMAATALLTWDMATIEGIYTTEQRRLLTVPWVSVAPLPIGFSQPVPPT